MQLGHDALQSQWLCNEKKPDMGSGGVALRSYLHLVHGYNKLPVALNSQLGIRLATLAMLSGS